MWYRYSERLPSQRNNTAFNSNEYIASYLAIFFTAKIEVQHAELILYTIFICEKFWRGETLANGLI